MYTELACLKTWRKLMCVVISKFFRVETFQNFHSIPVLREFEGFFASPWRTSVYSYDMVLSSKCGGCMWNFLMNILPLFQSKRYPYLIWIINFTKSATTIRYVCARDMGGMWWAWESDDKFSISRSHFFYTIRWLLLLEKCVRDVQVLKQSLLCDV